MLLTITEQLPAKHRRFKWFGKPTPVGAQIAELRGLLDMADSSEVTKDDRAKRESKADAQIGTRGIKTQIGETTSQESAIVSKFKAQKLDALERHLQDYKSVIKDGLRESDFDAGAVIVDDFYLFQRPQQPDIVDYLHRLLRGTDLYLKLGTVRHRTSLMRFEGQVIGVEVGQDVEEISLDRTFEDVDSTRDFLRAMLDSMCMKVGIEGGGATFISAEGLLQLTLASGGVPRDYLNTLVEAVPAARSLKQQRVTPRTIYRGAGRLSYRTKLKNLRDDVADDADHIERVFSDIATFCLKEERKTGFLINQQEVTTHEAQHEVIQQLMDFKLIHVIEPDTSAASGRQGRFEAYTLDFALFMEPRLRGINHIEFWKTDEQRRRKGVREAPAYPLARAEEAMAHDTGTTSEATLEGIEEDLGTEDVPGRRRVSRAGSAGRDPLSLLLSRNDSRRRTGSLLLERRVSRKTGAGFARHPLCGDFARQPRQGGQFSTGLDTPRWRSWDLPAVAIASTADRVLIGRYAPLRLVVDARRGGRLEELGGRDPSRRRHSCRARIGGRAFVFDGRRRSVALPHRTTRGSGVCRRRWRVGKPAAARGRDACASGTVALAGQSGRHPRHDVAVVGETMRRMNVAQLRASCLRRAGAVEDFPFGAEHSVFKVAGRMFAISALGRTPLEVSLKCDPELAVQLRSSYPAVRPGYHLNKRHWNTITLDGSSIPDRLVHDMIEDSYDLVVSALPRRVREQLGWSPGADVAESR